MYTFIDLNHNKCTVVDYKDYKYLNQWKWSFDTSTGYVYRKQYKGKKIFMHRLIMEPLQGLVVDHINGDKLDNRRINLKICTIKENIRKHKKMRRKTSSSYMGVSKFRKGWRAYVYFDGKQKSLGYYKTEKEAAIAYNEFVKIKFEDNIILNKL